MRFTLKEKGNPKVFTVVLQLIIALTLLFIIPLESTSYLFNTKNLIIFSLVITGTAIIAVLFTTGRQLEEASNVSIGVQVGRIWNLFGAALILGEPLTPLKIIGVGLIMLGNFLISFGKQKLKLSRGMIIIIVASLMFSTINFGDKYLLGFFSTALYNFILYSVSSLILLSFIKFDVKKIINELKLHGPIVFLTGLIFAVGIYFFEKSIKLGEVSRVVQIHSSSIIFTVLLGIILLKERENLWKKILATISVFVGVYLLII